MRERRKLERFKLDVAAKVESIGDDSKTEIQHLETRDISADGAFFISQKPLLEGVNIKLEMVLSMDKLKQVIGKKSQIELKIEGTVIRSDSNGIAVIFDKKYHIRALDGLNNNK